jgi:hypothetical protein
MTMYRDTAKADSNNEENANQNICAQAVARALGNSDQAVRYLHNIDDIVRAARKTIQKLAAKENQKPIFCAAQPVAYIVRVEGHALLMDNDGNTIVDTDPRKADRRKITHFYAVTRMEDVKRAEFHSRLNY